MSLGVKLARSEFTSEIGMSGVNFEVKLGVKFGVQLNLWHVNVRSIELKSAKSKTKTKRISKNI